MFVARGFFQKEGVDHDKIFASVARYTTIRLIIALVSSQGWSLHQMDVKITFLHGSFKEEVYVQKPQGFEVQDRKTHVCRLKKSLYGLKQAPRGLSASISCMSWKHKSVSLITVESEYIDASMACCEVVWLRKLFNELFEHTLDTTMIFCDNQNGIHLSENPVFHDHSKHIDMRYHFIQDMVQWRSIRLQRIRMNLQVTDIFTKPLGKFKFLSFCERLGVVERPSYEGPA
eukprot:PITA_01967